MYTIIIVYEQFCQLLQCIHVASEYLSTLYPPYSTRTLVLLYPQCILNFCDDIIIVHDCMCIHDLDSQCCVCVCVCVCVCMHNMYRMAGNFHGSAKRDHFAKKTLLNQSR